MHTLPRMLCTYSTVPTLTRHPLPYEVTIVKPRIPVISNVDAKTHSDPDVIKQILAKQVHVYAHGMRTAHAHAHTCACACAYMHMHMHMHIHAHAHAHAHVHAMHTACARAMHTACARGMHAPR